MKKTVALAAGVLAAACLAGVTACGNSTAGEELVLYTPTSEENLKIIRPSFEAATGIKLKWVYGSSGDIKKRVLAEVGNPQGDVIWYNNAEIEDMAEQNDAFEAYVSKNDKLKAEGLRSEGHGNPCNYTCPVLIWNKKMVNGTITSYADVLAHPEVQGKIAWGDATGSSSAYDHVQNIVVALGSGNDYAAMIDQKAPWDYIEGIYKMLDKKIISSSSISLNGVVSGEYAVGFSWDTKGYEAMEAKSKGDTAYDDIEVCFMKEGVVASPSGVAIMKGSKHQEAAKKFVDWMCSKEAQTLLGNYIAGTNPVIGGVELSPWKHDISELKVIGLPASFKPQYKPAILAKLSPIHQKYTA